MAQSKIDLPSLSMVLAFTSSLIICYFDPFKMLGSKEIGIAIIVCGCLFFVYVLLCLRSGFFGEARAKAGLFNYDRTIPILQTSAILELHHNDAGI